MGEKELLIIDAAVLPDVFTKVLLAKDFLLSGMAKNTSEAVRLAGVSRSAFYKYRDCVYKYKGNTRDKMCSLHIVLHDMSGMLSKILTELAKYGGNILTVNQDIPSGGIASVSITLSTDTLSIETENLLENLDAIEGVISARIIHSN